MDNIERAVLAALESLEADDDAEVEPTAEVLAARAGVPFADAAVALERMVRQGLVLTRPVTHFTSVAPAPLASPPRYSTSARGRGMLVDP